MTALWLSTPAETAVGQSIGHKKQERKQVRRKRRHRSDVWNPCHVASVLSKDSSL